MSAVSLFRIEVPDAVLSDLKSRLRNTRWPEAELVDDWSQGAPLKWIRDVCSYWAEQYDWRKREAALNRFTQFTTDIDGQVRTGRWDGGCDQLSDGPVTNRPLTAAEVGTSWMEREKPIRRKLVTLAVDCADSDVEPAANQAIQAGEKVVARSLSGAFGHHVGTGLALVYLPPELAEPGTALQLAMLGTKYPARVVPDSPHDPKNLRPRALDPRRGVDAGGDRPAPSRALLLSTS